MSMKRFRIPVQSALWAAAGLLLVQTVQALEPDRALTQYVHRIWQMQQGLPDGPVWRILQSRSGYLWFATQTGLVRFDGVRFTSADQIYPGLPGHDWARDAYEDPSGKLWLATMDDGVWTLSPAGITHYTTEDGLPANLVQCITPGAGGVIWGCTESGVVRIDPNAAPAGESKAKGPPKGAVAEFTVADGLAGPRAWAACEDAQGVLWVGNDNARLSKGSGGSFESLRLTAIPETGSTRALVCDGDTVWVGTSNGLVRMRAGQQKLYTVRDGLVDNFVLSLSKGSDGVLWIGTRSGFSRMRGETFDSFYPREGLSQSTAQAIFEDREGSLWVGTKRGLNQFFDGRTIPYTVTEGLPSNEAGPILQDAAGIMWAGTLDAGLAAFDGKQFTTLTTRQGLASDSVHTLIEDADHSLWVGTTRGLNRVRDGRVAATFTTANGLPSADVRSLFRDSRGVIWAGTTAGAAHFEGGRFVADLSGPRQAIRAINEDRDGRIVLATEDSVFIARAGGFHDLAQDGVYMRNATALYRDKDGFLWVGLNGAGLRLVDGSKITVFNSRVGLYDGEIYGILVDALDRLWMTCSRGVFWVPRQQLLQLARGEIKSLNSFPYTPTDSQRVIESRLGVQPSLWITKSHSLWFSTIRGLIAFDPDFRARALPPPPVAIENPVVDGQSTPPVKISSLPAGQKNIEFHYAGLSFVPPEDVRFRYRLEGYDTDWVDAGARREAFYTNLPPGSYRFDVVACTTRSGCNQDGASVAFALAPRLYERAFFWPLVALLTGLLAWGSYQLHIRRLRERYDLILSERSRIARELHDTLIQGFSGITMALQAFSARIRAPEAREALDDIIQDAATCLRETRQSVAGLRAMPGPHSGLAAAIARAAREITETKDVRLKLSLDPDVKQLPAEVEYNLLRIMSEAVNNSVKHSGAHMIEVGLQSSSEGLYLSVKDDGVGFDRENGGPGAGHYGLIGMKERATQIGAELELVSQPGGGTKVCVSLPAGRALEVVK